MRIKGTSAFSSIKFDEGQVVPNQVQVLRVGKFNHPQYGAFEITNQVLAEMKANFDLNVRGVDTAFDYFHDSDKEAAAWVTSLFLKESGTELWAEVDWTPTAQKKLAERELRYFSPDFAFKWTDPEKGVTFSNVLFGGGLTNRPFVKEMKAIVADEPKGEEMTDLEKAQAEIKKLSDACAAGEKKMADMVPKAEIKKLSDACAAGEKKMADMVPKAEHDAAVAAAAKGAPPAAPAPKAPAVPPAAPKKLDDAADGGEDVASLQAQIADLKAQLAKAKGDAEVALKEKGALQQAAQLAEKTTQFNVLLSEGKACAAQKDAFLKGDMAEFVKLSQPVNLKGSGVSDEALTMPGDDAKAIIKLAEEKEKANPRLSRGEAISLAKKELKK